MASIKGSFKQDEEDHLVLIVRIDFIEFPSSRILKLVFLDDNTIFVQHDELPGKQFALTLVKDYMAEMADKPIISSVLDRVGGDYIEFKVERIFSPAITVKRVLNQQSDE